MLRVIFSFVVIILLFLSTVAFTVFQIQRPGFLANQARTVDLYGRVSTQADNLIPEDLVKTSHLSRSDWKDIITTAIPADRFYSFLSAALGSGLDWLTGRTDQLNFQYDLTAVKQDGAAKAKDRLLAEYATLPTCQTNQLRDWSFDNGLPSCQLPASKVATSDIERLISQQVDKTTSQLPDQLTINHPTSGLLTAKQAVMKVLLFVYLIWLITALSIVAFIVVLRRRAFFYLAAIFLLVGLIQVGFSLIAWDWLGRLVADVLGGSQAKELAPAITDLTKAVLEVLKTILGNLSIFFLSFGVLMIVCGFVWRPRSITAQPTTD